MITGNIRECTIDVSNLNSKESIDLIKTLIGIYENIDNVIFTKKYLTYSNVEEKWVQTDFPYNMPSTTVDEVKEYAIRIKKEDPKETKECINNENIDSKVKILSISHMVSIIGFVIILYAYYNN